MVTNRAKVFVGNLQETVKKEELKRAFGRFGQLRKVWLAHNPPGFAFIEFFNSSDAKNCVRNLDGKTFSGSKIRVEISYSDGPKAGTVKPSPKGKMINKRPRQNNGSYWNTNNMQMRRNRPNQVTSFNNGISPNQLRKRNFNNAFRDVGMNFRGKMNTGVRNRNNFMNIGPRGEPRGYKFGAADVRYDRKRNDSYSEVHRRRETHRRDLSSDLFIRPKSPDSDIERSQKHIRYNGDRQNGNRNHKVYLKDTRGEIVHRNGDLRNGHRSANSASSSDGSRSTESHSRSPDERRKKRKHQGASPQRRRSDSPTDSDDDDVSPIRSKKKRKHSSRNRGSHENDRSSSDRSGSARQSSPDVTSHGSRHHKPSSSPEVRSKQHEIVAVERRNGRGKPRHSNHVNGKPESRWGYDTSQRRHENLPMQYKVQNGDIADDCSTPERKQTYSSDEETRADWSKRTYESSPHRKSTNHSRHQEPSPKSVNRLKQVAAISDDKPKKLESSPERSLDRNKRCHCRKRPR